MSEVTEDQAGAEVGHPITNMLLLQAADAVEEHQRNGGDDMDQIEAEFLRITDEAMQLAVKLEQGLKEDPDGQARKERINARLDQMIVAFLEA